MEHTKLLSIVKDILNEGKTLWKAPKKYQNEAHAKVFYVKLKRCQVNCKSILQSNQLMVLPSYGVDIEVNKAFDKKATTLDNSMDTYTKEVDGFEITLADGYYPLEIA